MDQAGQEGLEVDLGDSGGRSPGASAGGSMPEERPGTFQWFIIGNCVRELLTKITFLKSSNFLKKVCKKEYGEHPTYTHLPSLLERTKANLYLRILD